MKKVIILSLLLIILFFSPGISMATSSTPENENLTAADLWKNIEPIATTSLEDKPSKEKIISSAIRSFFGISFLISLTILMYSIVLLVYCFFTKKNKSKALKGIKISIVIIVLIPLIMYMISYIQLSAYFHFNPTA